MNPREVISILDEFLMSKQKVLFLLLFNTDAESYPIIVL